MIALIFMQIVAQTSKTTTGSNWEAVGGMAVLVSIAIASAVIAKIKNRSVVGYFFLGFFLNLIGLLIIAFLPKKASEQNVAEKPKAQRHVDELIKALGHKNAGKREASANALLKIGQPAVEPLLEALAHGDEQVRKYAAETLEKMGMPIEVISTIGTRGQGVGDSLSECFKEFEEVMSGQRELSELEIVAQSGELMLKEACCDHCSREFPFGKAINVNEKNRRGSFQCSCPECGYDYGYI